MKNILSFTVAFFICLAAFSQKDVFKVKMKVEGMQDSACYLINYFGSQRYYKDTANFDKNGVVIFSGTEHHPGGIYGVFTEGKLLFEIVLNREPSVDLETKGTDYIANMKVNKSEENKLFFEHLKLIGKLQKDAEPIREKLKDESINTKEKEELSEKLNNIGKEINNYRLGIIEKHPKTLVAVIFKTMKEPEAPKFEDAENDSIRRIKNYYYVKEHYFDDVDLKNLLFRPHQQRWSTKHLWEAASMQG